MAKVKRKTKFAYQAVSHCRADSGRDYLTKKIRELIQMDVSGKCFGVKCSPECHFSGLGALFAIK